MAAGIKGSLPDLADSIYQCIHKKDGRILDQASEKLAAIRVQRQVITFCPHCGGHASDVSGTVYDPPLSSCC